MFDVMIVITLKINAENLDINVVETTFCIQPAIDRADGWGISNKTCHDSAKDEQSNAVFSHFTALLNQF